MSIIEVRIRDCSSTPIHDTGSLQSRCSFGSRCVESIPLPRKRRIDVSNIVITDRAAQNNPGLGATIGLHGTHNLYRPPDTTHAYSQAQVDVSDYGLARAMIVIHFFLIAPSESPCPSRSPTQSLDSTQTMLRPHSALVPVCDDSTSSDSTHTAPTSMKLLDCVAKLTVSTCSNRIR